MVFESEAISQTARDDGCPRLLGWAGDSLRLGSEAAVSLAKMSSAPKMARFFLTTA
jgi:hypothetical protein